jgi:uncharacterized protein (DUF488 family)
VATIYTIGHSTRTLEELLAVLKAHSIATLVDIRAFPVSRRLPHFNREALEHSLAETGIGYVWKKELGGRRRKSRADSPNTALRSQGFRNYADHMLTEEFAAAAQAVVALAEHKPTAIMCAERLFFRCHRMLVSDYLTLHGHAVLHIEDTAPAKLHKLTAEVRLVDGRVIYPGLL